MQAHLTERQRWIFDTVLQDGSTVVLRSPVGSGASTTAREIALEAARRGMSVTIVADFLGDYSSYEYAFEMLSQEAGVPVVAIQSAADLRLILEEAEATDTGFLVGHSALLVAGDALDSPFVAKELGWHSSGLLIVDGSPRTEKRAEAVDVLMRRSRRRLLLLEPTAKAPNSAPPGLLVEWSEEQLPKPPVREFQLDHDELLIIRRAILLLSKYGWLYTSGDPTRPSLYEGLAALQEEASDPTGLFDLGPEPIDGVALLEAEDVQRELEALGPDPRLVALVEVVDSAPRPLAVVTQTPWDADFLAALLEELPGDERVWRASGRSTGPPPYDIVVCSDLDIDDDLVRRGPYSIWWDEPEDDHRLWFSGAGCVARLQLDREQQSFLLRQVATAD
jgi:hypothetical protein